MLIQEDTESKNCNCSFCGTRRANAIWMGFSGKIYCCDYCASSQLPQFMADAMSSKHKTDEADSGIELKLLSIFKKALIDARKRAKG